MLLGFIYLSDILYHQIMMGCIYMGNFYIIKVGIIRQMSKDTHQIYRHILLLPLFVHSTSNRFGTDWITELCGCREETWGDPREQTCHLGSIGGLALRCADLDQHQVDFILGEPRKRKGLQ